MWDRRAQVWSGWLCPSLGVRRPGSQESGSPAQAFLTPDVRLCLVVEWSQRSRRTRAWAVLLLIRRQGWGEGRESGRCEEKARQACSLGACCSHHLPRPNTSL